MLFEVEGLKPKIASEFREVERTLRSLKIYGRRSFASLTNSDGTFVQAAGGGMTCMLERRLNPGQLQRAFLQQPRVPFEGTQTLSCGAGMIQLQPDEFLSINEVIEAFCAFFEKRDQTTLLLWRNKE